MGAREPSASTTAAPRSFRCEVCGRLHAEGVDGGQRCQSIGERVTAPSPPPSYELLFGPPAEGHVLAGRYHLHRRLGRGAYAVVHAATDLQLGREVAVKLGPDPDAAAIAHRRFLREAQMMAEVGGPGTVIVYDYGVLATTGHPFIVMERLRGETLRVRMERQRPMALDEARDIAGEVLLTLSAFHARGVIHRDLKPENVFLHEANPGEWIVKILDFGLARLEDESNLVTEPWEILGTPLYMAPELFRNSDIGHRADLFAVATMLFEMLTGEAPLERDHDESLLAFFGRSVRERRKRLRALRPDLPSALDDVLARALELDEENRHEDARALLDDLLTATGGDALLDSSGSWRLSWPPAGQEHVPSSPPRHETRETLGR